MKTRELARSFRFLGSVAVLMVAIVGGAGSLMGAPSTASGADFTLSVSPSSATVQPGTSQRYTLTVTGKGFAGTVHVGLSGVSPQVAGSPTFSLSRYDIAVSKTSPTGTARITASTTTGTPAGTYTVTVTGKDITGGAQYGLTHSTTFTLTVG